MASTEFTKKFRAAIRTKIQELGIEVDDELTDYIMIMIANKKDKSRMKSDLVLFLSDHTDTFVDWLFEFFDKVNKKESEESKPKEAEKPVKRERKHSEEKAKSRSRSPVRRSRSRSPKRSKREEEKPRRQPIRAPSPGRDGKGSRRRRSRSPEDDRRRHRGDRKKVTYSESDDEEAKVRSTVVPKKTDKNHSPPRVSSQVVVKKRKADPAEEKAASSLFKRAINDSLREDDIPKRKSRRLEDDGVLQVNTAKSTKRKILVDEEISDESEEERETQFIVKMNKAAAVRNSLKKAVKNKLIDGEGTADENTGKRRRRQDDPVRAFLKLSGVRAKGNVAELDEATRKKILAASQSGEIWDGKISIDDEDISESDNEEAEIDAFLADSLVPPTVSLSRPIMPAPQKKQFIAKATDVGKIPEKCRFYPNCRNEAACLYSHPSKPCMNFPNCWFGDKCLFIHPKCKFEPNCSKPGCPYMHTMPRTVAQKPLAQRQPNPLPITSPEKEEEDNKEPKDDKKEKENNESGTTEVKSETVEVTNTKEEEQEEKKESEEKEESEARSEPTPDVAVATSGPITAATAAPKIKPMATTASSVPCRFGARCHTEGCTFRHPKKCRYDEACTNDGCYFWHPKKNSNRFRWTKTAV
ncbi:hypothetical protein FO519_004945 [Halicephalobus sp. NKZ332]|nr:hypothetical protein FO519_004945 [Halicephalobus sp. NKZ332]